MNLYRIVLNKVKNLFWDKRLKSDKELYSILERETNRQQRSLELIASENFVSQAVLEANGTIFTNKYSEGYPTKRYYGGNEYIDELEILCQKRALKAFGLDESVWGVNVQSYSGSTANFSVYTALLKPGSKLMGLDLPSGGHLTHGYATPTKKISNSSIYFNSMPYIVGSDNLIDHIELEKRANAFCPDLVIVGASAYPRDFDYKKFRKIADTHNSYLMADMAHISGLVSTELMNSPFKYCDVVTTTTHKTLRGPRAALIFYKLELKDKIDFAVFPSSQGGPHNNTIAAVATALKEADTPEFKKYCLQVIQNAQHLASELQFRGFNVVTGGTDNHIVLLDLKNKGVKGSKFEKIAEMCSVSINKNTIATDSSALSPSGIRIGTSAMTTRGFTHNDFVFVASVLDDICKLCVKIQITTNSKKLVDFIKNTEIFSTEINTIKNRVEKYCLKFPLHST